MSRDKSNRPDVRLSPEIQEQRYVRVAPVNLDYIKFSRFDPAQGKKAKQHRMKLLKRAAELGNNHRQPVEIYFKSRVARLKVREIITGIQDGEVHLNDGRRLPIRSIRAVRYEKQK